MQAIWKNLLPLPFTSLFGRKVAWSWKVVVLCHPCDRSLLLECHLLSLAFLEGGVAGHRRVGTRRPGWKRFRLSLFSQWCWWLHMGIGRIILLKFFGLRWRPFWFLLLFLFLGVAFIHFLKRHPLILLCKFTTSGDCQGHTQGLVSTFFHCFWVQRLLFQKQSGCLWK